MWYISSINISSLRCSPKHKVACHGQQCNDDQGGKSEVHNIGDHQVKCTCRVKRLSCRPSARDIITFQRYCRKNNINTHICTCTFDLLPISMHLDRWGPCWTCNVPGITESRGWKPIACMRCTTSMRRTTPCRQNICQCLSAWNLSWQMPMNTIVGMREKSTLVRCLQIYDMLICLVHTWST